MEIAVLRDPRTFFQRCNKLWAHPYTAGVPPEDILYSDDIPEYVSAAAPGIQGIVFTAAEDLEEAFRLRGMF